MQKCQEKYWRKRIRKNLRNGRKSATKKDKNPHGRRRPWPMVAGDHRNLGSRIFAKNPFFGYFFCVSICLVPAVFQKSNFRSTKYVDLCQHHRSATKIVGSSSDTLKSPTGRPRKHTFCPINREIDWIDVVGPLVAINA